MRYYRKIAGEKVYLSPMNADDAEQYTEWLNRRDVTDNVGNTDLMMTLEGERVWISQERDQYQFAIVEQSSNRLLGNCGIQNINWRRTITYNQRIDEFLKLQDKGISLY